MDSVIFVTEYFFSKSFLETHTKSVYVIYSRQTNFRPQNRRLRDEKYTAFAVPKLPAIWRSNFNEKLYSLPPAEKEVIHTKEELPVNTPKIVFKSDIPEEALNSLAALFIEEIEKILKSEEGKAGFEKWMKEHTEENKE